MNSLITCLVAGAGYLIHPHKLGSIQETINPDSIIPVTLLTTDEIFGDVDTQLHFFDVVDDVFVPEFGGVLVEKPGGNESALADLTERLGLRKLYHLDEPLMLEEIADLPSGPYFLYGPNLYQAWKLYDDTAEAFSVGVIPEDVIEPNRFRVLNSLSVDGASKAIAVPSLLYHPPPNPEKPLSGVRLSITESLSLNGLYTTLSSRAWSSLQISPAHSSAPFVGALLHMGAIIVGKTKTAQFDAGGDWIDSSAPWNPRGDGYQVSGGASAGASAALAAYDWLQFSFARDSIDGLQRSAVLQGVFSFRPSVDAIANDSLAAELVYDALGFSSRSIDGLFDLASCTLDLPQYNGSLPQSLLLPLDFMASLPEDERLAYDRFVRTIENSLGIKAEPLTLSDIWAHKPPPEADGLGMHEYMEKAPLLVFCFGLYRQYDTFRQDYRDAFDHPPFVEPMIRSQWKIGKNLSESDYRGYKTRLEVFRRWFDHSVMSLRSADTMVLLPTHRDLPKDRDTPHRPGDFPSGITLELLSPVLQTPHLSVPFAQVPFESEISTQTEYLPVSGSVIGPKGTDLMLIQTVKRAFELAAWPIRVDTGALAFPVDDNSRNINYGAAQDSTLPLPLAQHVMQR